MQKRHCSLSSTSHYRLLFKLVSLQCAIAYFVLLITPALSISIAHLEGCDVRMLSIMVSRSGQSPRFSSLPAGRTKTVT